MIWYLNAREGVHCTLKIEKYIKMKKRELTNFMVIDDKLMRYKRKTWIGLHDI